MGSRVVATDNGALDHSIKCKNQTKLNEKLKQIYL